MHTQTFVTINSVTAIYVRELEKLRDSLRQQLNQVEQQIGLCVKFADDTAPLPLAVETPAGEIEPEVVAATQKRADEAMTGDEEPLPEEFLGKWREDMAAKHDPGAVVKVNAEGRPVLTAEELQRLDAAIKE